MMNIGTMLELTRKVDEETALDQLAEEAVELAHAALKLQRIRRGNSPSPVTEADAMRKLMEEASDVTVCLELLACKGINLPIAEIVNAKAWRWLDRIKAKEEETNEAD